MADALDQLADGVAAKLTPPPPEGRTPNPLRRWGTIVAYDAGGCDVELSDSGTITADVSRLLRYRPLVGQRVLVDTTSDTPVIVDAVATAAAVEDPIAMGFQNGWVNFDAAAYTPGGYWRDPELFVHTRGLTKNGTLGAAIATLPVGYRPEAQVRFGALSNGAWSVLDILTDGTIVPSGGSNLWVAMSGLAFPTSSVGWHALGDAGEPVLQNGWVPFGAPFYTPAYYLDANGFVRLRGVIKSGTATAGTLLFTLPPGFRPPHVHPAPAVTSSGAYARVDIYPDGRVLIVNGNNTYLSFDGVIFPIDTRSWHPLRLMSNWVPYNTADWLAMPGYMVDDYEMVHFAGMVKDGTLAADLGHVGPGAQPPTTAPTVRELLRTASFSAPGRVDLIASGTPQAITPSSASWVLLDNLQARVRRPGG